MQCHADGTPNGVRGCWCVVRRVRVPRAVTFQGKTIVYAPMMNMPITSGMLDGYRGLPRQPGQWLISSLICSDTQRRGIQRLKELDKWQKEAKRNARKVYEDHLGDVAADSYRGFANILGKVNGTASKEDHLRNHANAERRAQEADDDFERELMEDSLIV
jgi:hypothetical protein